MTMSSDFDRAVEFAGCERREALGWAAETHRYCDVHDTFDEPSTWPCRKTLDVLRLIQEVRADECERLRPLLDEECPHEPDEHAEGTCEVCDAAVAVDAALQGRAEKHREGT